MNPKQEETNNSNNVDDPVTKAVVDNIIGNLPTKKQQVRCNDCDLDFTSPVVLNAHLHGARHAKQIRSKNILASLEETNVAFTKDQETNGLKCNVCNVHLNSIQQLQTHLNGNRHKKKVAKGDWSDKEIVSGHDGTIEMSASYIPQPIYEKPPFLTCNPCNKFFNSQAQLNVHLQSQKHIDKVNNTKSLKKKRFNPYWKKGNRTNSVTKANQTSNRPLNNQRLATQPLSKNFIPGGYENYY